MSTPIPQPVDDLTGLMMRKDFHETLDALLEKARASETPVSVADRKSVV